MIQEKDIIELIEKKQEGPYWDFKRQWYEKEKRGNMLHDIISMANNTCNRDAYIIIGVDEENDYALVDVSDDINRKNTQNLVDFLRSKKFAGEIRPLVFVETLKINNSQIDVIVVPNNNNTPYYLIERFNQVRAYHIYSRVQDTNTPTDKSADILNIEYLWRKRFGLESPPLERITTYLKNPEQWVDSPSLNSIKYYKHFPEFTVSYCFNPDEERTAQEYYHLYQTDPTPIWTDIKLKYHQTVLVEFTGLVLDGGRYFTPCPEKNGISLNEYGSWDIVYCYFVKDSLRYVLHEFYYENSNMEEKWANRSLIRAILIFETEYEHQAFRIFVSANWQRYSTIPDEQLDLPYIPNSNKRKRDIYYKEARDVQILRKMLCDFRLFNKDGK